MKKKGAGMMMAIMIVSVSGWAAIVSLIIKPVFWIGVLMSLFGGAAIACLIISLMWHWWFKRILTVPWPDEEQVDETKKRSLGTRFVKGPYAHRYACAGEDLKKGMLVEANLSGRLVIGEPLPEGQDINALIYGAVRPAAKVDKHGRGILGWPLVDVTANALEAHQSPLTSFLNLALIGIS